MKNIFNSLTGSFFRTIGRVLAYVVIALIVAFFLGFINIGSVSAATRAANEVTIGGSSLPRTISVNTSGVNNLLVATLSSTYAYDYEYAIVEMCSSIGLEASVYNPSYNYYFNDTSYLYNTGRSCTISGQPGQIYYMFLSVGKWDIGSGNVSLYQVSSYIRLRSTWGYNGYVAFQKFMFSDEDMSIEIQQNQNIVNNIYNSFNSLNQTQQETNDKLDDVNQNLDNLGDKQDQTNQELGELNDNITSTEGADLDSLGDSAGWLPAGPIDSILNLPLTYLNSLMTSLGDSCNPITLTLPFIDETISLPCLSSIYSEIDGLSVWINTIGVIASAIILFSYFMRLYKWVDDTLSFRENNYIDNWGGV